MAALKGTKTEDHLKRALAAESQANLRYLWFATQAEIEGYPAAAVLFRAVAETETGHAFGHLEYLVGSGDPLTHQPVGSTEDNFRASIAAETYEAVEQYPNFAQTARDEGFDEIAEWFDSLARAEKSNATRLTEGLAAL